MARLVEDVNGKDKVRLVFRLDRFGRGGDHRPFAEAGLPAVRFTEPLEDYRHEHQTPRTENGIEYGDLPKFMDFDFVAETADVVVKTLAEMANAPAPPRRVTLGGAVTPNSEIFLEGNRDPERAGYEILWRETTEARWSVVKTVEANAANSPAAAAQASPGAPPRASSAAPPSPSLPLEESLSSVLSSDLHRQPLLRGAERREERTPEHRRRGRRRGAPSARLRLRPGAVGDAAARDDPGRAAGEVGDA